MKGMLYVYKSMLNKLQHPNRSLIIFVLMMAMMISLFLSRAALSITIIVFVLVSVAHRDFKRQSRVFISSPQLWCMSLLFVLPLLSGFWSADKEQWVNSLRIKLPLLVLPFAFASPFSLSKKQWDILAYSFIAIVTIGMGWCMYRYTVNAAEINESYLQAKSIVTPCQTIMFVLAGW